MEVSAVVAAGRTRLALRTLVRDALKPPKSVFMLPPRSGAETDAVQDHGYPLWSAIRALQEKSLVLGKVAESLGGASADPLARQAAEDAEALLAQADSLRLLLGSVLSSEEEGIRE